MYRPVLAVLLSCLMAAGVDAVGQTPAVDSSKAVSQPRPLRGFLELQASQTGERVPFWMRSRAFGSIPLQGTSLSLIGGIERGYRQGDPRKADWGAGVMVRANAGATVEARLIEAYLKLRLHPFELRIGRSREMHGITDTLLGSGPFTVSGTALGIPKADISLPDYALPLFDTLVSFKGNFSAGVVGETPFNYLSLQVKQLQTYYHQKSFYVKLGKPGWRFRAVAGIVHQAFWYNGQDMWGSAYTLTPAQTFTYVVTGKDYTYKPGQNIQKTSNIGNHNGSIDLGLEILGDRARTMLYHQVLYESENSFQAGSLNDGLTGISITNRTPYDGKGLYVQRASVEYFRSTDQAYSPNTPNNYDSYFNHEFMINGNSYLGAPMGIPLITPWLEMRPGLPRGDARIYFPNTRVRAFHAGLQALAGKTVFRTRLTVSSNLGTYDTQKTFPKSGQFSSSIEAVRALRKGWQLRGMFAFDSGELLPNSAGLMLGIARLF